MKIIINRIRWGGYLEFINLAPQNNFPNCAYVQDISFKTSTIFYITFLKKTENFLILSNATTYLKYDIKAVLNFQTITKLPNTSQNNKITRHYITNIFPAGVVDVYLFYINILHLFLNPRQSNTFSL